LASTDPLITAVAISADQYRNDHFIIGVDTEKILEAGFTGLNTKAGRLNGCER
jgi:hypothetical protein